MRSVLPLQELDRRDSRRDGSRNRTPLNQLEMGSSYPPESPSTAYQGVPVELKNRWSEAVFVSVCSMSKPQYLRMLFLE